MHIHRNKLFQLEDIKSFDEIEPKEVKKERFYYTSMCITSVEMGLHRHLIRHYKYV